MLKNARVYESEISTSNYKSVTISGSRSYTILIINQSRKPENKKTFPAYYLSRKSSETDTLKKRFSDTTTSIINKIHESGAEAALYMFMHM